MVRTNLLYKILALIIRLIEIRLDFVKLNASTKA